MLDGTAPILPRLEPLGRDESPPSPLVLPGDRRAASLLAARRSRPVLRDLALVLLAIGVPPLKSIPRMAERGEGGSPVRPSGWLGFRRKDLVAPKPPTAPPAGVAAVRFCASSTILRNSVWSPASPWYPPCMLDRRPLAFCLLDRTRAWIVMPNPTGCCPPPFFRPGDCMPLPAPAPPAPGVLPPP